MMKRKHAAWAVAIALAISPAAAVAQQTGNDMNVPTETQERHSEGRSGYDWNWLGLLGLLGVLGLRQRGTDHNRR